MLKVSPNGSQLIKPDGHEFNEVLCTMFAVCREELPWNDVKQYIDTMFSHGIRGFRALLNVAWGPTHTAEHGFCWAWGGSVYPKSAQDRSVLNEPLMQRIDQVLNYLNQKNGYLQLDILDPSPYGIGVASDWYTAKDDGWRMLIERLAVMYHQYGNMIIGTGNEPAKCHPNPAPVRDHQKWLVQEMRAKGIKVIIAEISPGVGIPELISDPDIPILAIKTSRNRNTTCLVNTWSELKSLRFGHPNKIFWGSEPPRRNYGGWTTDEDKERLRAVMWIYGAAGVLYTHHGLSQNHELPDNTYPLWGCTEEDWIDIIAPWNIFFKKFGRPPAGPNKRTQYYCSPDNSIVLSSSGHIYCGVRNNQRIIACFSSYLTVKFSDDGRIVAFNPVTGKHIGTPTQVEAGEEIELLAPENRMYFYRRGIDEHPSEK